MDYEKLKQEYLAIVGMRAMKGNPITGEESAVWWIKRIHESRLSTLEDILEMKKESWQQKEAISPMGIVSVVGGEGISITPEFKERNLQYVKVFDIEKYIDDIKLSPSSN